MTISDIPTQSDTEIDQNSAEAKSEQRGRQPEQQRQIQPTSTQGAKEVVGQKERSHTYIRRPRDI